MAGELHPAIGEVQRRLAARRAAERAEFRSRSVKDLQAELSELRQLTETFAPAEVSARAADAWGRIGRLNRELSRRGRGAD